MKSNFDGLVHFPVLLSGCQDPEEHQALKLLMIKQSKGSLLFSVNVVNGRMEPGRDNSIPTANPNKTPEMQKFFLFFLMGLIDLPV